MLSLYELFLVLILIRRAATYGGHMELSAFAHLMRRNVKVIQPGLVYVIEWAAGGDPASFPTSSSAASANPREQPDSGPNADLGNLLDDRERRHLRRDRKRAEKERERAIVVVDDTQDDMESLGPIYVAYVAFPCLSSSIHYITLQYDPTIISSCLLSSHQLSSLHPTSQISRLGTLLLNQEPQRPTLGPALRARNTPAPPPKLPSTKEETRHTQGQATTPFFFIFLLVHTFHFIVTEIHIEIGPLPNTTAPFPLTHPIPSFHINFPTRLRLPHTPRPPHPNNTHNALPKALLRRIIRRERGERGQGERRETNSVGDENGKFDGYKDTQPELKTTRSS